MPVGTPVPRRPASPRMVIYNHLPIWLSGSNPYVCPALWAPYYWRPYPQLNTTVVKRRLSLCSRRRSHCRNFQKIENFPNFLDKKIGNELIFFLALSLEKSSLVNGAEAINDCLGYCALYRLDNHLCKRSKCGKIRHELAEKCKVFINVESFLFCKSVKRQKSTPIDKRPIYCPFSSVSLL